LLELPKYVDAAYIEYLCARFGEDDSRVVRLASDPRAREMWIELLSSDAEPIEIGRALISAIQVDKDYEHLREVSRQFVDQCQKVSKRALQLRQEISALEKLTKDEDDFAQYYFRITDIPGLLMEAPSRDEPVSYAFAVPMSQTWNILRYWVCGNKSYYLESKGIGPRWESALAAANIGSAPEQMHFPPFEDSHMRFLERAWESAPRLPELLDHISQISDRRLVDPAQDDRYLRFALASRKSSRKRDYLRALWADLILIHEKFVMRFENSRGRLFRIVATMATTILDLEADDEVTEADARQALHSALPNIRAVAEEVSHYFDKRTGKKRFSFLDNW